MEVAGVAGVVEDGVGGGAAGGGEGDDGSEGVGAVERGVGTSIQLGGRAGAGAVGRGGEAGGRDGAVIEGAADVFGGDAVDQDFVGVGVAAAHEEGGDGAGLAGLDDEVARRLAEVFDDADAGEEVVAGDERDGGGELGKRSGKAGGGDGDVLADLGEGEDDVLGNDIGFAAVEIDADVEGEATGRGEEAEAAGVAGADLKGAVRAGNGEGAVVAAALEQLDVGPRDGGAEGGR